MILNKEIYATLFFYLKINILFIWSIYIYIFLKNKGIYIFKIKKLHLNRYM